MVRHITQVELVYTIVQQSLFVPMEADALS